MRAARWTAALAAALVGCSDDALSARFAGPDQSFPPEPATTGNKWIPDGEVQADGSQCYVLADEECAGWSRSDYLTHMEAPIFRTGHAVGTTLYAADGSNLWSLDVETPGSPVRLGITAAGRALAVTGRGQELYVAAGEHGLLSFTIDAAAPARPRRHASIQLTGPALDVALDEDGGTAWVAIGERGVVPVALGASGPSAGAPIAVPGFAAGVTVAAGRVYVAGCSSLTAIDAGTRAVLGTLAITAGAGQAPLPVKDVAADRDVAFVAAGRWGTVFVDISNPRQMRTLGNRTLAEDLLFYGNGVTVHRGNVYVAAGDWGVDRFPVSVARAALGMQAPTQFPRWCSPSEDPERQPAPEFATVLPPPRTQDPLDVIPAGDALYAMGDASRLGVRAVDVYQLDTDGAHTLVGRYEEPGLVRSVTSGSGKILVAGKRAGVFVPSADARLLVRSALLPETTRLAAESTDGRIITLDTLGAMRVEGVLGGVLLAPALAIDGDALVGMRAEGLVELYRLQPSGAMFQRAFTTSPFRFGVAHAVRGGRVYVASGDWERVMSYDLAAADGAPAPLDTRLLAREDFEDAPAWAHGPPRRVLVPFGESLAEVVSFGGRGSGALHRIGAGGREMRFSVPAGPYVGGASDGSRLWLVVGDRAHYRTSVVEVDFGDFTGAPVVKTRVYLGSAVGAAVLGGRLYVADADVGMRVLQLSGAGAADVGVATLLDEEVSP